ncbi:hypothetical protein GCM10007420_21300 [Glycocaulis albus]|uniref:Uncharacterized protein n=1 Tax=Glycocaulis albus TaxID=1382801 RepID=A0ABQ1XW63_9PROT|nr:hypothetical protein [Glycocaulis albus]GGH04560.1 hypothetical protein GCM10007420_21300 [Glycocaulis albus]
MTARSDTEIFTGAGHEGPNVLHILVRVLPYQEVASGAAQNAHKVYIGAGSGDFQATYPTRFIFALADEDWEFHEFELDGKTWPGLAIFPQSDDFEVSFGDPERRSVVLDDACEIMKAYRYQIIVRHRQTGELASCDPAIENSDREKV